MEPAWRVLAGSPAAASDRWIVQPDELNAELPARVRPGDLVLLKGSRGLEMERVLPLITASRGGDDAGRAGGEKC
jgi:UDP-N-acetylmuramyl pentapeptide synthase